MAGKARQAGDRRLLLEHLETRELLDGAAASLLKVDQATQGSWQGVYGTDGYNVIGGAAAVPSYAQVTPSGESSYLWAGSTSDPRALAKELLQRSWLTAFQAQVIVKTAIVVS